MESQRDVIDRIMAHSTKVLRGQENEDLRAMADLYAEAQNNIISLVRNTFTGDTWTLDGMQNRAADLFNQIQQQLDILNERMTNALEQAAVDQMQTAIEWGTYGIDQATPPNIDADVPPLPTEAIKALINTPFEGAMFSQRYGLITDQMAADVRGSLTQSMINGESMADAAARIEETMGADSAISSGYADRALAIARTEIMRAQNLGLLSTYDANSDLMQGDSASTGSEWVATADDRLCEWCLRRDGLSPDEIEQSKDEGDPWGNSTNAPLHPRCRCVLVPRLKSWDDLGLGDMPENVQPDEVGMRNEDDKWVSVPKESFDDWKASKAQEFATVAGGTPDVEGS